MLDWLTPAEEAAYEVLKYRTDITDELVAAVVAAVRKPLLREAAHLIETSERLRSLTDDHMRDVEMAAEELRRIAECGDASEEGSSDDEPWLCPCGKVNFGPLGECTHAYPGEPR